MKTCVGAFLFQNGLVLLGLRSQERLFYPGIWDAIGGHVESRESIRDALGVRPSNRHDNHVTSCCAPTLSVTALGDGRVGVPCPIESDKPVVCRFIRRDDTA